MPSAYVTVVRFLKGKIIYNNRIELHYSRRSTRTPVEAISHVAWNFSLPKDDGSKWKTRTVWLNNKQFNLLLASQSSIVSLLFDRWSYNSNAHQYGHNDYVSGNYKLRTLSCVMPESCSCDSHVFPVLSFFEAFSEFDNIIFSLPRDS